MRKLHFEIVIDAPKQKVWETVIGKESYSEWTTPFSSSPSYFEGNWEKGSMMKFLSKDEQGKMGGMLSEIVENKPGEFLSIKHVGMIMNGVEDTESESVKKWAPAFENYSLREEGGGTKFIVDMDADDGWVEMFNDMWPKALEKLKEIAER
jgi:uncharacterized protein YndB with AHSA1/START domain